MIYDSDNEANFARKFENNRHVKLYAKLPDWFKIATPLGADFIKIIRLVEAYVFRRSVCAIPTNSMNKTFATFIGAIDREHYLESIQAHFLLLPSYRRFPTDDEFKRDLKQAFAALSPGEPFLFKLHSPLHFIVGGGFFVRHSFLPLSLAWEAFEKKNGSAEFDTFNNHVRKYRASKGQVEIDPVIGCIILANPFFFEEADWIPIPANWSPNIVQGKTYNTEDQIGLNLWRQVQERIEKESRSQTAAQYVLPLEAAMSDRYGNEYLTKPRLGQGAFRVLVTEAYQRRCAITGERTLPVLNASHIKPYAKAGPHDVSNGLLLREDLHTIFDRGYLTITKDFVIEVSHRLKEDYGNGKDYYAMHGRKLLILPENPAEQPSPEYIRWHNENVYAS